MESAKEQSHNHLLTPWITFGSRKVGLLDLSESERALIAMFSSRAKSLSPSIGSGKFLEWAEFQGNLYGTPLPEAPDGMDILLEIDVQGATAVVEKDIPALLIFVDAPSVEDQARRLRGRGDPETEVEKRILKGERERERAKELGAHIIINDDLELTIQEIRTLIESHAKGHQK